jgi:hypothetical protein
MDGWINQRIADHWHVVVMGVVALPCSTKRVPILWDHGVNCPYVPCMLY